MTILNNTLPVRKAMSSDSVKPRGDRTDFTCKHLLNSPAQVTQNIQSTRPILPTWDQQAFRQSEYRQPPPDPPVKPLNLQVFQPQDIGFFYPGLPESKDYPVSDVTTVGKDLYYQDVHLFVQQVYCIARIKPVENLSLCLRGSSMQWFATLPLSTQDVLNGDYVKFGATVTNKYQMSPSLAVDKMTQERYSMEDAKNLPPADDYVQAMLRYGRSAGDSNRSSLMRAWKNLAWGLQRNVFCPTNMTSNELVR